MREHLLPSPPRKLVVLPLSLLSETLRTASWPVVWMSCPAKTPLPGSLLFLSRNMVSTSRSRNSGTALHCGMTGLSSISQRACGVLFSTAHAMCCPQGGFPTIRHNKVRDMVGELLTEVCHAGAIEPQLAPLSGEVFTAASANTAEDARADVRVRGFWTRAQDAFFDVRVFHPDAVSYSAQPLDALLLQHERQKKLQYGERILNVNQGTFSPLM